MSDENKSKVEPIERIRQYLEKKLNLNEENNAHAATVAGSSDERRPNQVLKTVDLKGLIEHWKDVGFKKIVTMVGAGISTSAGIPDFRSPESGLYNNLRKYKLPYPTAIFELDYFARKPKPFFTLAKELYPGNFQPTDCHYFIRLLHEKGLLRRHYTQNIDTLERVAGMPDEILVEAHGTFATNHCVDCRKEHTMAWMKDVIFRDEIPKCTRCAALVKPDIVFFGENLPGKFYKLPEKDFAECDLLIVMGTSLEVHPFAGLINLVGPRCVRLLINLEKVGTSRRPGEGFMFGSDKNHRDVLYLSTCEEAIRHLSDQLGYTADLENLIASEQKQSKPITNNAEKKSDETIDLKPTQLQSNEANDKKPKVEDASTSAATETHADKLQTDVKDSTQDKQKSTTLDETIDLKPTQLQSKEANDKQQKVEDAPTSAATETHADKLQTDVKDSTQDKQEATKPEP